MATQELLGMIIGFVAVAGGLTVAVIAVWIGTKSATQEKLALIESRNKERLALIEKGMDPTIVDKKIKDTSRDALLWGLLLAGIGLGAGIGYLVDFSFGFTCALTILFGGIGLISFFIYKRKFDGKTAE